MIHKPVLYNCKLCYYYLQQGNNNFFIIRNMNRKNFFSASFYIYVFFAGIKTLRHFKIQIFTSGNYNIIIRTFIKMKTKTDFLNLKKIKGTTY